jgi:hypothetical protein
MHLSKLPVGPERHLGRGKRCREKRGFQPALESLEQRCLLTGDPVLNWNAVAMQAAVNDHALGAPGLQFGPTRTSRALAIVQAAVFDAVNSIEPTYTPYLIQVPAPPNASIDAAVAAAAHETLVALYPYQRAYFDQQFALSLQGIPLIPLLEGVVVGSVVGDYILDARANDGSQIDAPGQQPPYIYGQLPGQWRADPTHPDATPLTPDWGSVTPFVVQSATQFGAPPPPAIDSQAYADAYLEVRSVGEVNSTTRTDNETNIGFFWGYDAQPGLCAPVRFYNQLAQDVAIQAGNTVLENARMFALINLGMADAGITSWNDKYRYDLWRPVTAIRENDPGTGPTGLGSGNPYLYNPDLGIDEGDPDWTPLGAPADNGGGTNFTPPFPSYTSGHATFGGVAFKMMEDFYQTDSIPNGGQITCISDEFNTITVDQNGHTRPLMPRTFDSFSQMAGENAQSRVYLGIHWHFDAVEGIRSGNGIADYVFNNALRPLNGGPTSLPSMDPEAQIQLAIQLEDQAAGGPAPRVPGNGSGHTSSLAAVLGSATNAPAPVDVHLSVGGSGSPVSSTVVSQVDPRTLLTSGTPVPATGLGTQGSLPAATPTGAAGQDLSALTALGDLGALL